MAIEEGPNKSKKSEKEIIRETQKLLKTKDILLKLQDSLNQFVAFSFFDDLGKIKKQISETNFKKLEEVFSDFSPVDVGENLPELGIKYNGYIEALKDPNLEKEQFKHILEEVRKLSSWITDEINKIDGKILG